MSERSDAISDSLPTGWAECRLDDIASMRLGKMLDRGKKAKGKMRRYLRNINVRWREFDLEDLLEMDLTDDEADEFALRHGDLLICEGGEPGRSAVWKQNNSEVTFQKALHRLRLRGKILPEWVMYDLWRSASDGSLEQYFTGSTIKHLTGVSLATYRLRIAPVPEQRRIVAKVEELLARVNAARERLAKAPTILRRFRQSVLTAACSGQFAGVNSGDDLPSSWTLRRLDSMFEIRTGGTPDRKRHEYFQNGAIPWVRTTEVQNCEIYDTQEKITKLGLENSSAKLFPAGTLLIALYGEGKTRGQVARLMIPATTNQACSALINEKMPEVTKRFVYWSLRRDYDRLREQSAGGNQPNLSNGLIKAWEIAVPPLADQRRVVDQIEGLFAIADKIESRVQAATLRVEKITQAILAKAFRGELVPTEAELARQEGRAYESACSLLERIRSPQTSATDGVTVPRGHKSKPVPTNSNGELGAKQNLVIADVAKDICLLLDAWGKAASINAIEPALIFMRNPSLRAGRQTSSGGKDRPKSAKIEAVSGLDLLYARLVTMKIIEAVGRNAYRLRDKSRLKNVSTAERKRATDAIEKLTNLMKDRDLSEAQARTAVASVLETPYEITGAV